MKTTSQFPCIDFHLVTTIIVETDRPKSIVSVLGYISFKKQISYSILGDLWSHHWLHFECIKAI